MKQAKLSHHSDYDMSVLHKRSLFQNFQLQNVAISRYSQVTKRTIHRTFEGK